MAFKCSESQEYQATSPKAFLNPYNYGNQKQIKNKHQINKIQSKIKVVKKHENKNKNEINQGKLKINSRKQVALVCVLTIFSSYFGIFII